MQNSGVLSLVTALLAWASYVPVAKFPALRKTMWPTWLLNGTAMVLAAVALFNEPFELSGPQILALLSLVFCCLFVFVYWTVLRVPQTKGRPEIGMSIPQVSLIGENGQAFSPHDYIGKGPLLLIFFRGFW